MPFLKDMRARLGRLTPGQRSILVVVTVGLLVWLTLRGLSCDRRPETSATGPDADHGGPRPTGDSTVVALDSAGVALAGLRFATADSAGSGDFSATGIVTYDQNRVTLVAPPSEGRLVRVLADLGQAVTAGQELAQLESPEVGSARGDLERARADVEVTREGFERERTLFEQKISPKKDLSQAEADYQRAQADLRAAEARLRTLGALPGGTGPVLAVRSPISGIVVQREATPGQIAGPSDTLFTVADLERLWVELDAYEEDLGRLRAGQVVTLTTGAFRDSTFRAEVTYVGQIVDPQSRTVKVRVVVANPGLLLRPGMFVTARISGTAPPPGAVSVPDAAVQRWHDRDVVFVPLGEDRFRAKSVQVGDRLSRGRVVVTVGLRPGERVVADGSFYLKSELEKESFGQDTD
jgi:cobalt-zinc-cadmium efflux system membrane fusion protein